jgi:transketolase
MRRAFIEALTEAARTDPKIVLLTGDLGFMALEPFIEAHPDRFFNAGVAEQNMIGVATGLAEAGWKPYCYSIVTFATLRPYEFIRNGPILHRLPVRIVGVGGGMEYGHNGLSHFGLEDVAIMRTQPEMTVICPADAAQAKAAALATIDLPGPAYFRLGKDDRAVVPGLDGRFRLGEIEQIGDGGDILLVSMGAISKEACAAAAALKERKIDATLAVVSTMKPSEGLRDLLGRHRVALTVESHYLNGGLGSMVSEIVAENGIRCRVKRCGVERSPIGVTGSQAFLEDWAGISGPKIAESALSCLEDASVRS